jgi:hypothetical protein
VIVAVGGAAAVLALTVLMHTFAVPLPIVIVQPFN